MLRIQFEKQRDGAVVFRCTRDDGSVTWQKHVGKTAHFFPFHDLSHYVVLASLQPGTSMELSFGTPMETA